MVIPCDLLNDVGTELDELPDETTVVVTVRLEPPPPPAMAAATIAPAAAPATTGRTAFGLMCGWLLFEVWSS
jgi:hypothetical protein